VYVIRARKLSMANYGDCIFRNVLLNGLMAQLIYVFAIRVIG